MIKILRVTTTVRKGGAGAHVLALHNGLNKTGRSESHLLCPRDAATEPHSLPWPLGRLTSNFNFVKTKFLGLDSIYSPSWNSRFQRLVQDYDIIHLHHLQGYFFDIRSLSALREKNVVLTLHDVWPLTGRCSVLSDCDRWQSRCFQCPHTKIYPSVSVDLSKFLHEKKKQFFGSLKKLKVVVLSDYGKSLFERSYLREKELYVIPPEIDLQVFQPLPRTEQNKLTLGAIAAKPGDLLKGGADLQRLIDFLAMKKRQPYQIHIVGHLEQKYRRQLARYPFVIHTPFIADEKQLNRLYNTFDVLLNFSQQETFGKTVIEAQAAGIPVLARRIPAFEENVLHGRLVDDVSPESIVREVEILVRQKWDRVHMHQSMSVYSVQRLVDRHSRLYQSFRGLG